MNQSCASCGRATLRVLLSPTQFRDVAYFRCSNCGDVWTLGRHESEARRITRREHTHSAEDAVLFTCPQCKAPLAFEDVTADGDFATVTFACPEHGYFKFTDHHGLTPARTA